MEPDPPAAAQTDALRWVRRFGVLLLTGMGIGLFTLPWPWPLLSGVLCVLALVAGVVALVKVRVSRIRGAMTPVLAIGLVLAAVLGMASLSQVVLWREYDAYSSCLREALTEQARDACSSRLERLLDERLQNMQQMVRQAS
ncbi:cytochrome d ubiquinol oxidase subunit II [Georgenia yuyongxinii]|uniref:Cytochrome d ubiquinol oxidase subunit II n=1 Tax=Georgenia yuyongxinii TaxID=2589797 RepID=A0A5B8C5Q8_9MICO|nr:cytochrome d ubiquinol oxidase subunit II [Georgenia yuyongxinii]QDC25794.1 cytochrome d ubiquinol oxidase subunit II [Georgenia yuyongxinii]